MHSDAASNIIKQAEGLKAQVHSHASRIDENFKVGVEIEICLIDRKGTPVDAKPVIELLRQYHDIDFEYGICQLEYRTKPVSFERLGQLNFQFEQFIEHLDLIVNKVYKNDVFPGIFRIEPVASYFKGRSYHKKTALPTACEMAE